MTEEIRSSGKPPGELERLRGRLSRSEESRTKSERINAALRLSEKYFRSLVENSLDIITIIDKDGIIAYSNPAFSKALGYGQEELLGVKAFGLVHEEDLPEVLDKIARMVSDPDFQPTVQFRFRHQNGSWVFFEAAAKAVFEGPELNGIVVNSRDITLRKETEDALARSEHYYRSLIKNAVDMITIIDTDFAIRWGSPATRRITGYSREDTFGKSVLDFVHPDDVDTAREAYSRSMREPDASHHLEAWFRHKDGSYHYHDGMVTAHLEDPSIQGIVINSRDMTERKLMEEDLQKHREHLEELVRERTRDLEKANRQLKSEIAERKRAEEELERSEAYFRHLIENTSDITIMLNEDLTMRFVSPSVEELFGYAVQELVGESAFDFFHPEDIVLGLDVVRQSLEHPGERLQFELRIRHKDQTWHYLECIGKNLLRDNVMKGFVVSARDITERKRMEESLRASEERYRSLVEDLDDVIMTWSADGFITYVSPAISRHSGYTPEELVGRRVRDFTHPDDLQIGIERMQNALDGGVNGPYEYRVFDKDGSIKYVRLSSRAINDGRMTNVIVVMSNITEQKQAEQALRESESRYRTLFETSTDAIFLVDPESLLIVDCNDAALEMFGHANEEMKKLQIQDLATPEAQQLMLESIGVDMASDQVLAEIWQRRRDGSIFPTEVVVREARMGDQTLGVVHMRDITKRKEVEEALRESEGQFRLVSEQLMMGLFIIQDDMIKYANQGASAIYEYTIEESLMWAPGEYINAIYPDDRPFVLEQADKKQRGDKDQVNNYIHRIITKTGNVKWIETYSRTVTYKGRKADLVANIDITDRVRMEEELRRREEYFRSLIEESLDGIAIVNERAEVMYSGPAVERILGYGYEEFLGKTVTDLMHPDDLKNARESLAELMGEPGREARLKLRARHKDGSYRDIETASRNLLSDPSVKGIVINFRDITEQRRITERLEKVNHLFLSLGADLILNMEKIIETGKDVLGVSMASYSRMEKGKLSTLSTSEGEDSLFITDQPGDYLSYKFIASKRGDPWIIKNLDSLQEAQSDPFIQRYAFKSFGGYPVHCRNEVMGCLCIFDEEEREFHHDDIEILGMLARALSVEEERLVQEQSLKDFIDVASHELRHPITLMKGYALTLRDYGNRLNEEARQDYLTIIGQGADRLDMLIKELLDVSRIERGRFALNKREVRLEPLVERAVGEMRGKGCSDRFNVSIPAELAPRNVDPEKLVRVLVVLLDNAVVHTPERTPIDIVAEEKDGEALISVLDRGVGIPEKDRERIFERFYQVEDALHHSAPGMGLGLYIAKEIVEAHYGIIWHEPREDGGSIFLFTIP